MGEEVRCTLTSRDRRKKRDLVAFREPGFGVGISPVDGSRRHGREAAEERDPAGKRRPEIAHARPLGQFAGLLIAAYSLAKRREIEHPDLHGQSLQGGPGCA